MHVLLAGFLLLPAILAAQGDTSRLRWVPNPRVTDGGWVADPAAHLRHATRARIDSIAATLERETGAELAVVVIDSLDGLDPADAALLLHRRWGVGKRERDNGIVLLWSPALRRTYVSVGYGLEGVLPDARAGRIQDQFVIPRLRAGDFDGGMVAGAQALAAAAREERYAGLPRNTSLRGDSSRRVGIVGGIFAALAALVAFLVALVKGAIPRRCPNGHGFMHRLHERSDNAFLGTEQLLEEKLGSMDYDVWACRMCDATVMVPRKKWFSGYEQCPKCRRRTSTRTTRQLVAPTRSSEGKREVRRNCRNCGFSDRREERIPRLQVSASGSGGSSGGGFGGGSSFGGGSAGGGGASRGY